MARYKIRFYPAQILPKEETTNHRCEYYESLLKQTPDEPLDNRTSSYKNGDYHMKHFLRLCLLLLCLSACKQKPFVEKVTVWPGDKNVESLDRNNGFKDLKLNRHISSLIRILDKSEPGSTAGYTIYQVKADSLAKFNIDDIKIKSIKTHFRNNLLFRFEVDLEGETNSFPFYLQLIEAYGGAYPENTRLETYQWIGNRVSLKYTVKPNRNATAEFTSIVLSKTTGAVGAE